MSDPILYLDHAATTAVRPAVREAMEPFLSTRFGNAASSHGAGRAARAALEQSRERIAAVLGARRTEIVLTGSGTEADNLAVLGRWRAERGAVVVSAIEHSAVREAAAQAAREGAAMVTLAVDEEGRVDLGGLDEALESSPAVVSVMWGNNEVGTVQPVAEIAERCRARGAAYHTDAVQAVGHIPVRVDEVGCDLLSLSAHKIGGPQGVGALFVRDGCALEPLLHGGGQERGLRPGTSNVAGAVGLAVALEEAAADVEGEAVRLSQLRDRLAELVRSRVDGLAVHAERAERLPHILNLGVDAIAADVLLASLDQAGLAVSTGSACHSGAPEPSHVLLAMGRTPTVAVRLSLGWTTTPDDIVRAADLLTAGIARVRALELEAV